MSDAARAKSDQTAHILWEVMGNATLAPGVTSVKKAEALRVISEALDAYAAEQTAGLRALVERQQAFMTRAILHGHAMYESMEAHNAEVDWLEAEYKVLLADPEDQR